jgi:hypothetical protein
VTVNFATDSSIGESLAIGGAPGSCASTSSNGGTDYETTSGTLTFVPGDTSETITVLVCADVAAFFGSDEGAQGFFVFLASPTGLGAGGITDGLGQGTIVDDDDDILVSE